MFDLFLALPSLLLLLFGFAALWLGERRPLENRRRTAVNVVCVLGIGALSVGMGLVVSMPAAVALLFVALLLAWYAFQQNQPRS